MVNKHISRLIALVMVVCLSFQIVEASALPSNGVDNTGNAENTITSAQARMGEIKAEEESTRSTRSVQASGRAVTPVPPGYALVGSDTITRQGTTDSKVWDTLVLEELKKKYPGYKIREDLIDYTLTIAGDGSTVVRIFYDIDEMLLSYEYAGVVPPGLTTPEPYKQTVDEVVTLPSPAAVKGYKFTGWTSPGVVVTENKFTMPPKDTLMTGNWEANCECVLSAPLVKDYKEDIGVETGITKDLLELGFKATYDTSNCIWHDKSEEVIVDKFELVSGSGSLSGSALTIEDIDKLSEATIKATATKTTADPNKTYTTSATFKVTITRSLKAPQILSAEYDSVTKKLTLNISPNGHKRADIYYDGSKLGTVTFRKFLWFYRDTEIIFSNIIDNVNPNTVKNVNAIRNPSNPKEIIISWDDGLDADNLKDVYVVDEGQQSDTKKVNIQSPSTTKTVELSYTGSLEDEIVLANKQKANSVIVNISKVNYAGYLEITSFDNSLNNSGKLMYKIPHNVIYSPNIVNDEMIVDEGMTIIVLAKENDVHDPAFEVPLLKSVEIISGEGTVALVNAEQLTDMIEGVSGLVVSFLSTDGYTGDIKLKYTYTAVRDDIPEATGEIILHTKMRNQEPVAHDDGIDITSVLNAQGGTVIDIPASLLLKNDTDRENKAGLKISTVRQISSGLMDLVDNGNTVRLTPSDTFYGLLSFEYRITDGELLSNNWATVKIDVKKVPKPPRAGDVKTAMSLDENTKSISLKVDNTGGETYQMESNFTVYVNGRLATNANGIQVKAATSEDENGNISPYIEFIKNKQASNLKAGDLVTFNYTVYNAYGRSTAKITVEIIEGDDPFDMEGYLYVHRRPIAAFSPIINVHPSGSYVQSAQIDGSKEFSHDLDHNKMHINSKPIQTSGNGSSNQATRPAYSWKGIRSWEWGIKTITGTWDTKVFDVDGINTAGTGVSGTKYASADDARSAGLIWIQSRMTSLIDRLNLAHTQESIIVSLRVRDIDGDKNIGVWSDQRTVMLTSLALPPVALFELDKSTYLVPTSGPFKMELTDLSYDPNGDTLETWEWVLTDANGQSVPGFSSKIMYDNEKYNLEAMMNLVSGAIAGVVRNPGWNPTNPQFKLSLVVTDGGVKPSDKYSVTFTVYRENKAPEISDGNTSLTIDGSTVYEIDNAADGVTGDDWGTEINSNGHPGKLMFDKFFTITDDQSTSALKLSWLFEGEAVQKRLEWTEDKRVTTQKAYPNLSYTEFPFRNTVTAQGFKPGAYKISVAIKDNPTGNAYPNDAAQTSYWMTFGNKKPYHLYVVPKLDIFSQIEFNGWILSGKLVNGVWIDSSTRIADGATLAQAGLELEDIVPTIGDTMTIKVTTNQYVTELWGYEDYNGNGKKDASENKFNMTRTEVNLDGSREYVGEYTINDVDDAPDGKDFITLKLRIYGETNWGSETGAVTRTKQIPLPVQVLPVKLYDFRVTSLTDPNISDIFDGYVDSLRGKGDKLNNGTNTDGALVGRLAVDGYSNASEHPTNNVMRKGYSFYFSVCSKGLTKSGDGVRIYPKFYAVNSNGDIQHELIGCVPNKNGKYEVYTTADASPEIQKTYKLYYEGSQKNDLNNHAEVIIPTSLRTIDGSEQTWDARYGIPGDARFFKASSYEGNRASGSLSDIEWKGAMLVVFDIQAFKDGRSRYNYVERGQWLKERELIVDAQKTNYVTQEANWKNSGNWLGTVAIFDTSKSIRDDYISNPVWSE